MADKVVNDLRQSKLDDVIYRLRNASPGAPFLLSPEDREILLREWGDENPDGSFKQVAVQRPAGL